MDEAAAQELAETIMHEQNVDNLEGFGQINMRRIKEMLVQAAKTGYQQGYSEGFREAEG
jgi:hypothetical protein